MFSYSILSILNPGADRRVPSYCFTDGCSPILYKLTRARVAAHSPIALLTGVLLLYPLFISLSRANRPVTGTGRRVPSYRFADGYLTILPSLYFSLFTPLSRVKQLITGPGHRVLLYRFADGCLSVLCSLNLFLPGGRGSPYTLLSLRRRVFSYSTLPILPSPGLTTCYGRGLPRTLLLLCRWVSYYPTIFTLPSPMLTDLLQARVAAGPL